MIITKSNYIATARLTPPDTGDIAANDITAQGDTPAQAAQALAEMTPISTDQFARLLKRGYVNLGYTAAGRQMFYSIDSVMQG